LVANGSIACPGYDSRKSPLPGATSESFLSVAVRCVEPRSLRRAWSAYPLSSFAAAIAAASSGLSRITCSQPCSRTGSWTMR
jgi:hypothetical protein